MKPPRPTRDYADALSPEAADLETALKRRLLADPHRPGVAAWWANMRCGCGKPTSPPSTPSSSPTWKRKRGYPPRYTELLASAKLEIAGNTVNLAGLGPYAEDPDRSVRHEAEQVRWRFFEANGAALDELYDQLVKLRHGMARKLGFETYTPLGYRRLRRVDYGADEVARYRDQVARHVVPLVGRLLEARRVENGWDKLRFWDEALIDPAGNPDARRRSRHAGGRSRGDVRRHGSPARLVLPLDAQRWVHGFEEPAGKAGGGFCTSFPTAGMPFIFANFNGTHHDIGVFTHEMGHAFQNWENLDPPGVDYLWPTYEAAEINSMGLEFLSYPGIGKLVGEPAADRFRRMHLIERWHPA